MSNIGLILKSLAFSIWTVIIGYLVEAIFSGSYAQLNLYTLWMITIFTVFWYIINKYYTYDLS